MVFRQRGLEHCQRLIEAARSRLADLELEKEIERLKAEAGRRAAEVEELAGEVPF